MTLKTTVGSFRNYIAVASVRLDTQVKNRQAHMPRNDDEGFYKEGLTGGSGSLS